MVTRPPRYLGEYLGEALKDVGTVESAVKVYIQLRHQVRYVTQLQGENISTQFA